MGEADDPDILTGAADVVRAAYEHAAVLLVAYEGSELRVTAANASFRRFVQREHVVGHPLAELLPELTGQQIIAMITRVRLTREPQQGREWRVQFADPTSGELVDTYLTFVASPHPSDDDGVICYGIDVTEQVVARLAGERRAAEAEQRYAETLDVIADLQRALLPEGLPVIPGLDIAARYLIAAQDQTAGGDWFDALPLPDGRCALVVGDVVGHGVEASAAMGQLRAVLRELLTSSPALEEAVRRADAFAAADRRLRASTVAVVIIHPDDGEIEYCLCGHPAPLVVTPDGTRRLLAAHGGGPLGVGVAHTVGRDVVAEGDVVLLYSDGLIERPRRTLSDGQAELGEVAADALALRVSTADRAASPVARVCQMTVEILTRTGYFDDVTTLAVQRLAASPPALAVSATADSAALATVMVAVRQWVDGLRVDADATMRLELAVNEAVANVIAHAYAGPEAGVVNVAAQIRRDGVAEVRIDDRGRWQQPAPGTNGAGRGLALMARLVDEIEVRRGIGEDRPTGSTVTLRHRLTRATTTTSARAVSLANDGPPPILGTELHVEDDVTVLEVMGTVDASTEARFRAALFDAAHGGTRPVVINLRAVTLLSSTGVRALFDLADALDGHGHRMQLLAPAGGPAAMVLDIVGLPYRSA